MIDRRALLKTMPHWPSPFPADFWRELREQQLVDPVAPLRID